MIGNFEIVLVTNVISLLVGIFSNFAYQKLVVKFGADTQDMFVSAINDARNWQQSENNVYFYTKNPDFTIEIEEGEHGVAQRFNKLPDKEHSCIDRVKVKFKGQKLFGWNFMSLDGHRIFIPVPRYEYRTEDAAEREGYDYFDPNSNEVSIFYIVGKTDTSPEEAQTDALRSVAMRLNIQWAGV